jgi:hypothetical protein
LKDFIKATISQHDVTEKHERLPREGTAKLYRTIPGQLGFSTLLVTSLVIEQGSTSPSTDIATWSHQRVEVEDAVDSVNAISLSIYAHFPTIATTMYKFEVKREYGQAKGPTETFPHRQSNRPSPSRASCEAPKRAP